ncbi:MAG: Holliday junction branch migration protein RuvA [Bacteroidota bacterium]
MIHYIEGKITELTPTYAVIDCGGVGYLINISLNTFSNVAPGEKFKMLIHQVIREDAHLLFGFADDDERDIFRHLISVSGIGANTARLILSSLTPDEIRIAILSNNVAALKKIKGIGEKSALRILVDLRDKMDKKPSGKEILFPTNTILKEEALTALVALGFARSAAEKALDKSLSGGNEMSVEELIKAALKNL